jgi:hypothetical protein
VKRMRYLRPDETGTVSREALIDAVVEQAAWLDFAGGCLEVVVNRAPTGMPGEMVTTGVGICWKDRTDARPQPEKETAFVPETPSVEFEAPKVVNTETGEEFKVTATPGVGMSYPLEQPEEDPLVDPADGFDYTKLEAEDIENEPATT